MKLKYYIRGLGIGIIAVGLLMMVTGLNQKPMTDEEVIKRAEELGMVYSTTLSDINSNKEETEEVVEEPVEETKEENAEKEVAEPVEESKEETESVETDAQSTEEENTTGETESTETTETVETTEENETALSTGADEEYVILTISPGDGSDRLSYKAAELGLVENATDFDTFLMSNGYDKKLRVGSYEVKVGSTYEEIVNAIFN